MPDERPLLSEALRNALIAGAALGVVAALVVWWLERFELNKLHGEVRSYLENYNAFERWQQTREDGAP